jgi:hypothetical protein
MVSAGLEILLGDGPGIVLWLQVSLVLWHGSSVTYLRQLVGGLGRSAVGVV